MKRLLIFLLTILPFFSFAQNQVEVVNEQPIDLAVDVVGTNDALKTQMNLKFDFNEDTETLVVRFGAVANCNTEYTNVWLPVHEFVNSEMGNYMKNREVRMKKSPAYTAQDNFMNISGKTTLPCVEAEGMALVGEYELKTNIKPKKIKMLDRQLVPLDGTSELDLSFKVLDHAKEVKLTLRNPIPMTRKGRNGIIGYVANDIEINITLVRDCKNYVEMLKTVQEYEEIFAMGEEKLLELKKSSYGTMTKVREVLLNMFDKIDDKRFNDTGCEELQKSYDALLASVNRIEELGKKEPAATPKETKCDKKALNAEIKATTKRLNTMVNEWSLAGDAATKAEKKAAFQSAVAAFDERLNNLPSGCKAKLDAKLLKDYEFVKKLVK